MNNTLTHDTGALLLRLGLGVVLLAHGAYLKFFVFSLAGTAQYFASIGLPAFMGYVVFFIETIGGIALILGIYTRAVSLIIIPILLGATWAHWGNGWLFSNTGGGWEFPLFLTLMSFVQLGIGDGKYVLNQKLSLNYSE